MLGPTESVHESGQFSHVLFSHVFFVAHWLLMSMESQTRSSKQAFRELQSSSVRGNLQTLCQPVDNPSPTFRPPFANLSPTLCQPFRQPLSKLLFPSAPGHPFRNAG